MYLLLSGLGLSMSCLLMIFFLVGGGGGVCGGGRGGKGGGVEDLVERLGFGGLST